VFFDTPCISLIFGPCNFASIYFLFPFSFGFFVLYLDGSLTFPFWAIFWGRSSATLIFPPRLASGWSPLRLLHALASAYGFTSGDRPGGRIPSGSFPSTQLRCVSSDFLRQTFVDSEDTLFRVLPRFFFFGTPPSSPSSRVFNFMHPRLKFISFPGNAQQLIFLFPGVPLCLFLDPFYPSLLRDSHCPSPEDEGPLFLTQTSHFVTAYSSPTEEHYCHHPLFLTAFIPAQGSRALGGRCPPVVSISFFFFLSVSFPPPY